VGDDLWFDFVHEAMGRRAASRAFEATVDTGRIACGRFALSVIDHGAKAGRHRNACFYLACTSGDHNQALALKSSLISRANTGASARWQKRKSSYCLRATLGRWLFFRSSFPAAERSMACFMHLHRPPGRAYHICLLSQLALLRAATNSAGDLLNSVTLVDSR
jgi:hypothetical protein